MVGRFWIDGWWKDGLLVDSCSGPSSGSNSWQILLGGIIRAVFELRTWWTPNIGVNSLGHGMRERNSNGYQ
jgi:hypothetical protein